jgi:hypothetical protein
MYFRKFEITGKSENQLLVISSVQITNYFRKFEITGKSEIRKPVTSFFVRSNSSYFRKFEITAKSEKYRFQSGPTSILKILKVPVFRKYW